MFFSVYPPNADKYRRCPLCIPHPSAQGKCLCTRLTHVSSTLSPTLQYTVPFLYVLFYAFLIPLPRFCVPDMYVIRLPQHRSSFTSSVLLSRTAHLQTCEHTTHLKSSHYASMQRPFLHYSFHCVRPLRYPLHLDLYSAIAVDTCSAQLKRTDPQPTIQRINTWYEIFPYHAQVCYITDICTTSPFIPPFFRLSLISCASLLIVRFVTTFKPFLFAFQHLPFHFMQFLPPSFRAALI